MLLLTAAWAHVQLLSAIVEQLMVVTSPNINMGCCLAGAHQLMQGYSLERVSGHSFPVHVAMTTAQKVSCNLYSSL